MRFLTNRDSKIKKLSGVVIGLILIIATALPTLVLTNNYCAEAAYTKTLKPTSSKYGAKNGKDSTDAIQKALNDAAKLGKAKKQARVYLKKGTYYISKTLEISSNTCLQLEKGAVIKKNPNSKSPVFYMLRSKQGKKGGYDDNSNISVIGGKWDSEFRRYNDNSGGASFMFAHCNGLIIRDAEICNNYGSHLIELDGVKNCTISGCTVYGFKANDTSIEKEAIQLDVCHDSVITPGGEPYDDTPCTGITINGNEIYSYPRAVGSHTMIEGKYHSNINITNNKIHDISGAAVYGYNYTDIKIANNEISDTGCGIQLKSTSAKAQNTILKRLKGVQETKLKNNEFNISIIDNKIITLSSSADSENVGDGSFGIYIYGTNQYPLNKVTVKGNTIVSNSSAIYMKSVGDAVVKGNISDRHDRAYDAEKSSFAEDAIKLADVSNAEITDNRISTESTMPYENGIAVREGSKSVRLSENVIKNCTKSGILIGEGCKISSENDEISNSGKHGINADNAEITVNGSVINGCGEHGIALKNGAVLKADNITVKNPKGNGILAAGKSSATVNGSTITASGSHGMSLITGSKCDADGLTIENAKENGVLVSGEAVLNFKNGSVINPSAHGFSVLSEAECNVYDSSVTEATENGFSFVSTKGTITGTYIISSGKYAVNEMTGASVTMSSCIVSSSGSHGIAVKNGSSLTCDSTAVLNSKENGILVSARSVLTFNKGNISDNGGHGVSLLSESILSAAGCEITGNGGRGVNCGGGSEADTVLADIHDNAK